MTAKETYEVLDNLPEEDQQFVLALSVIMNRINRLDPADRDDLFALMNEWQKTSDREERVKIKTAMLEIMTQGQVASNPLALAGDHPVHPMASNWSRHVGAKIRKLREEMGLTQTQLAEKAGLPQPHISRIETATYTATRKTLEKIAAALGVPVGQLDPCEDLD
ncbi:helix-turn-helix domain-containing protein [Gemmata sp.]|uniref:helix-turn-helix domain-containing protein n=1 Tax=Gemmata sp. TaxID=1914242 RepID=UPI003F6EC340